MLHCGFSQGPARMPRPNYQQNRIHLGRQDHCIRYNERWSINDDNIREFFQLGQELAHFLGTQQFGGVGRHITSSKHGYFPNFFNSIPPIEGSAGRDYVSQSLVVWQVEKLMNFRPAQVSVEQDYLFISLGDGQRQIYSHRCFSISDIWTADKDCLQGLISFCEFNSCPQGTERFVQWVVGII